MYGAQWSKKREVIATELTGTSMKKPSQLIQPKDKPNPESETERLARQWVELIFEQLQHQKLSKNMGMDNTPCQLAKND